MARKKKTKQESKEEQKLNAAVAWLGDRYLLAAPVQRKTKSEFLTKLEQSERPTHNGEVLVFHGNRTSFKR